MKVNTGTPAAVAWETHAFDSSTRVSPTSKNYGADVQGLFPTIHSPIVAWPQRNRQKDMEGELITRYVETASLHLVYCPSARPRQRIPGSGGLHCQLTAMKVFWENIPGSTASTPSAAVSVGTVRRTFPVVEPP